VSGTTEFRDFYQFLSPTRVISGRGLLEGLGFEFMKDGAGRVLIVTDQTIRGTGLIDTVEAGVTGGDLEVAGVFDEVPQDSSTDVVLRCAEYAKEQGADSILAVGGGSVMDTAKVANVVASHGGSVHDYEGVYACPRENEGMGLPLPVMPLACVPTTAGTGSEVSLAAVIKDHEAQVKLERVDMPLAPVLAVLDPDSTATLPPSIAAASGMDAMTHAIESYLAVDNNPHNDAKALHALRLIRDNFERAVLSPEDENARGNMLVAASLAISHSLGITHSLSHPCGARYGVAHGVANAINLPHAIRFNAAGGREIADRYREINEVFDLEIGGSDEAVGDALASYVSDLIATLGLPKRLSEVGVPEEGIPALVEGAMGDGCTLMNPREPSEEEMRELYLAAL
jgi:alcohol dehydrogenase class IV